MLDWGRHLHSRLSRSQWEHLGRCSSHLTLRRLHVRQPSRDRMNRLPEEEGPGREGTADVEEPLAVPMDWL